MAHTHNHAAGMSGNRLAVSTFVTFAFVVGEAVAGHFAHSLALLSDAGHNFADALALAFSWYAVWIARRPTSPQRTFGYHRVGILAALVNAVSLVVIAVVIFWEAFHRLRAPEPVQSGLMIGVALVAVLMNTVIALALRGDAKHDLNMRGAYIHMAGDAASSVGVVIAGLIVWKTGAVIADPIVSMLIGAFILWTSWGVLKESVNVLLEATPEGMDMAALEQGIQNVPGVLSAHDLHVWTVTSGFIACSCHIMVAEQSVRSGEQVLRTVTDMLREKFDIHHATIQVEVEGCEPNDMYCVQHLEDEVEHDHDHEGHDHAHEHEAGAQ